MQALRKPRQTFRNCAQYFPSSGFLTQPLRCAPAPHVCNHLQSPTDWCGWGMGWYSRVRKSVRIGSLVWPEASGVCGLAVFLLLLIAFCPPPWFRVLVQPTASAYGRLLVCADGVWVGAAVAMFAKA